MAAYGWKVRMSLRRSLNCDVVGWDSIYSGRDTGMPLKFTFGRGKDKTIVQGSKDVVDGTLTFESTTFSVFGKGSIARDMGFCSAAVAAKIRL
ncbi:probable pectinesterase/pectinesterase inhibitor 46 [Tanacetum coccineum]